MILRQLHLEDNGKSDTCARSLVRAFVVIVLVTCVGLLLVVQVRGGSRSHSRPQDVAQAQSAAKMRLPQRRVANTKSTVVNDFAKWDVAAVNLRCSEGLPSSELLDSPSALAKLDRWALRVGVETERHFHRFSAKASEFNDSKAYFRMLMLIVVLQQDFGVHYNTERINSPNFANSQDLFIHGMLTVHALSTRPLPTNDGGTSVVAAESTTNGGTCVSMPVLYVAIGRRLGYPLHLAVTKGHVFARWDDGKERFNIEGTNHGLSTPSDDEYKVWPYELTESELQGGWYLKSLTADEERGLFMLQRGYCLEANNRLSEAVEAYAEAHRLAPKSPEALGSLTLAQRKLTTENGKAVANAKPADSSKEWLLRKRRDAKEYAQTRSEGTRPNRRGIGPSMPSAPQPGTGVPFAGAPE